MKFMKTSFFQIQKETLILISKTLIIVSLTILTLYFFPLFLLLLKFNPDSIKESFSITGSIGDTLNGIFNPLIGVFAVITTFLAFLIQYRANELYRKDITFQRFETRFYELLKIHKDNVSEIKIENKHQGRNSFIPIFNELRFLYKIIEEAKEGYIKLYPEENLNLSSERLMELTYFIHFFGITKKIRPADLSKVSIHHPFYIYCLERIKPYQQHFHTIYDKTTKDTISIILNTDKRDNESVILYTDFIPFNGFSNILGHYFRHLYQTVKFIANANELDTFEQKYEYMKIIRAQLSNFEQALLFYNSYFFSGKIWWEDPSVNFKNDPRFFISYFLDFALIKNLPANLTDFGVHPYTIFHEKLKARGMDDVLIEERMEQLFEWLEE